MEKIHTEVKILLEKLQSYLKGCNLLCPRQTSLLKKRLSILKLYSLFYEEYYFYKEYFLNKE